MIEDPQYRAELDHLDTPEEALQWWLRNGSTNLSPIAMMYLAIPSSTADAERTFSSAGFVLAGRWSLLPRTLEMQVVIRDWILAQSDQNNDEHTAALDALIRQVIAAGRAQEEQEEDSDVSEPTEDGN
jgi:hypothetical protein